MGRRPIPAAHSSDLTGAVDRNNEIAVRGPDRAIAAPVAYQLSETLPGRRFKCLTPRHVSVNRDIGIVKGRSVFNGCCVMPSISPSLQEGFE